MRDVQFGLVLVCCGLTLYNVFLCLMLRHKTAELKAFEDTLRELLMRIRARAIKRK